MIVSTMPSTHRTAGAIKTDTHIIVPDPPNPLPSVSTDKISISSKNSALGLALSTTNIDMDNAGNTGQKDTVINQQTSSQSRHSSPIATAPNSPPNIHSPSKVPTSPLKRRRSAVSANSGDDSAPGLLTKKASLSPTPAEKIDNENATLAHHLWAYLSQRESDLDDGRRLWLNKYNTLRQHESELQVRQKSLNDRVLALE